MFARKFEGSHCLHRHARVHVMADTFQSNLVLAPSEVAVAVNKRVLLLTKCYQGVYI